MRGKLLKVALAPTHTVEATPQLLPPPFHFQYSRALAPLHRWMALTLTSSTNTEFSVELVVA